MRVIGLMSGTSLDGVDGALIETDGECITGYGPTLDYVYTAGERQILQSAVDAALAWRFQGERPGVFQDAEAVLTQTHARIVEEICEKTGLTP